VRLSIHAIAMLAFGSAAACVSPATEILVTVDTDLRTRVIGLAVSVTPSGRVQNPWRAIAPDAEASAIVLPGTFGVTPGSGPRDAAVRIDIEATISPPRQGQPTISLRRSAGVRFVRGQTTSLVLFLNSRCVGASPVACAGGVACTLQEYCEESGRTCGASGTCEAIDMPVAMPTTLDVTEVSTVPDVVDASITPPADVPCVPNCAGRACGDDGCGGVCGTCPDYLVCQNSACVCLTLARECTRQCCESNECGCTQCYPICP
jgi:hypothetical protein